MRPYLTRFLKSEAKNLAITGKPGFGKTVLAAVVTDHLQHPINGVSYNTLHIPISMVPFSFHGLQISFANKLSTDARIPASATLRAVASTLLLQLLAKRIGNVELFHVLNDAFNASQAIKSDDEYDNMLWNAVESALASSLKGARNLILVVDGVDESACGESTLMQRLVSAVNKATNVKLISFGAEQPAASEKQIWVQIDKDLIFDDVCAVAKGHLDPYDAFSQMDEMSQDSLVNRIGEASNGSFLWAKLAVKNIRSENSSESLQKAIDALISSNSTISSFVLQTVLSTHVSAEAKSMLLWLATAERPLHVEELATLAAIHPEKLAFVRQDLDVLHILKPLNSLLFAQDDLVYLRHGTIRSAILESLRNGKIVQNVKDYNMDLVTRMLVYMKVMNLEETEPSLISLSWHDTQGLLDKHRLLDFAVRYWPFHLANTTFFRSGGVKETSKHFSKVLPASVTVTQLQNTIWDKFPTTVFASYTTIALELARESFTTNSLITLQSTIYKAQLQQRLGSNTDATLLLYQAVTTSNSLLTSRHNVTMELVRAFLDVTQGQVTTKKTAIMSQRETCLVLLVECYKVQYGATSESVVTAMRLLLEHYKMVKDTERTREVETMITKITDHHHHHSSGAVSGTLAVKLQARKDKESAEAGQTLVMDTEYDEKLDSTTESAEASIASARECISQGRIDVAERIFTETWVRIMRQVRESTSSIVEERHVRAILGYANFLKGQQRIDEAANILTIFWHDAQHISVQSETSVSCLREVAEVMSTVGLYSAALAVSRSCLEYYKSTKRTQSSTYKELQTFMHSSSEQVMRSVSSKSSSASSVSTLEEIIMESTSSTSTIDTASYTAVETLLQVYTAQHRWADAVRVLERTLYAIWPALFAASLEDVVLPERQVEHCVSLAERLCQCYHAYRRISKEEDLRTRMYRALRSGRNVEDKTRVRATQELLRLCDESSLRDLSIDIQQELLQDYTTNFGAEHDIVVKQLRTLAELCRPRPVFIDYYQRLIRILNKNTKVCHPDALEPAVIVATELWTQGRYSDAVSVHGLLFDTFLKEEKPSTRFKDQHFVRTLFEHYVQCLRAARTDIVTIHSIVTSYRTRCIMVFGASATITVQAALTLARLCQHSKRYEAEAMTLYEELTNVKSDVLDHTEISSILESYYDERAALSLSATSRQESVSKEQAQLSVQVLTKRMTTVRKTSGWAHEESLSLLSEMVTMCTRCDRTETAVSELNEATVQILSSVSSASAVVLSSAATTIASSYIAVGQTQKISSLADELHRQVILRDASGAKAHKFDVTSTPHQALIFLAQLQYNLRRDSRSITEIVATLTTEMVYFEEFRRHIKAQKSLYSVLVPAARLHKFLSTVNKSDTAAVLLSELQHYFIANEGKRVKCTEPQEVHEFLVTMLEHLSLYQAYDFTRSVGIACNTRVVQLLNEHKYDAANSLAMAGFRYLSGQKNYHSLMVVKFVLMLGMNIWGRSPPNKSNVAAQKLLSTSTTIIQDALRVIQELKVNPALMDQESLSTLIGLLGDQQNYKSLVWLLTILWNSRVVQRNWQASSTLALGRRLIMARFLVGETSSALRLAEDVVYNCRRVHGVRHRSTHDMSILLSQLYTGVAQKYETRKDGAELAKRYYKKCAAIHENILRAFSDPSLADFDTALDSSMSMDGNSLDLDFGDNNTILPGEHVLQHFMLLKLALERLGSWPKDFVEYERLNADLFREFPGELKGFEGVEKWNLKSFGGGKAESNEDQLDVQGFDWRLHSSERADEWMTANGEEEL